MRRNEWARSPECAVRRKNCRRGWGACWSITELRSQADDRLDTANTYLYLVLGNGQALRYGIGVGREGSPGQGSKKYREWKPGPTGARRKKRDD